MDPTNSTTVGESTPAFLVGIAGSSSSGKTTLSLLLSEVFTAVQSPIHGRIDEPTVLTISQDDYFLSKDACPLTTFTPRLPADAFVVDGQTRQITTADTDCLASIDWQRLLRDVDAFLQGVKVAASQDDGETAHQAELRTYRKNMTCLAPYLLLVQDMACAIRQRVEEQVQLNEQAAFAGKYFRADSLGRPTLACQIGVVEGFLLFAREAARIPLTEKQNGTHKANDVSTAGRRTFNEATRQCQEAILDRLHERLFLVVDKDIAFQRRFSRDAYIDAPDGARLPGQMWRSEGYFEDVGWANHEKYHQYLTDRACDELEVNKLPGNDSLVHAIRNIMTRLVAMEQDARQEAVDNKSNEAQDVAMMDGADLPETPKKDSDVEGKSQPPSPSFKKLRHNMNKLKVEFDKSKHWLADEPRTLRQLEKLREDAWIAIRVISLAHRTTPRNKKKAYDALIAFAKQLDVELSNAEDDLGLVSIKNRRRQIREVLGQLHRSRFHDNLRVLDAKKRLKSKDDNLDASMIAGFSSLSIGRG